MSGAAYRGQPLVALIAMLGGWVAVRAMLLGAASSEHLPPASPVAARSQGKELSVQPRAVSTDEMKPAEEAVPPRLARAVLRPELRFVSAAPLPAMRSLAGLSAFASGTAAPQPPELAPASGTVGTVGKAAPIRDSRWSADGWLLLRRGGQALAAGGGAAPIYGASQLGAVVRYALAPHSAHRPALYLRGSAALGGLREREAAFGVSLRPLAGLPVVVAAEGRVNGQPSGTRTRPAVFAYTEMPPLDLPLATRAELYAQAGYVGGDFASAFADGQLRIDRRALALGRGELRLGAGLWGGAQRGAARLDLGPSAMLAVPLGGSASARLAVDWRLRVAGNAEPASGPALTLSAGF